MSLFGRQCIKRLYSADFSYFCSWWLKIKCFSLKDILENEEIKLDTNLKVSLAMDLVQVSIQFTYSNGTERRFQTNATVNCRKSHYTKCTQKHFTVRLHANVSVLCTIKAYNKSKCFIPLKNEFQCAFLAICSWFHLQ